jgi:hypothetical protein
VPEGSDGCRAACFCDHTGISSIAARRVLAARHADPRTMMRYDRARRNVDRHPNYILAAYMASGT